MAAHVLVVEDEPDIRDLVLFHLAHEGYRTRAAPVPPATIAIAWSRPI